MARKSQEGVEVCSELESEVVVGSLVVITPEAAHRVICPRLDVTEEVVEIRGKGHVVLVRSALRQKQDTVVLAGDQVFPCALTSGREKTMWAWVVAVPRYHEGEDEHMTLIIEFFL